ncbi:MAG: sulfurtransferase-like selenium metabolism protein YedF [Oscillospiraceae bacterium]|nr:sulfurtransferase-like selenium metabolism protein YedF [Oscillospiraceae bacterium]
MIKVNAMGDACPLPVVKAKNAIKELGGAGVVEVKVDNEIAVQNLAKMAKQKGYGMKSHKISATEYDVTLEIGEGAAATGVADIPEECAIIPTAQKKIVVAINSNRMGHGHDELGAVLMKGFIFALTQQDVLPTTVLFYNGGANLTIEGSASLEDLKNLEAQGVEIMTCGTCLNYYNVSDKLAVGEVTNMYAIVEKLTQADLVVMP